MNTFLRRLAILDYLRSSRVPKSTDDILNHLLSSDYLGYDDMTESAVRRTIQRDMNFLYGATDVLAEESYNEFGLEVERGAGKSLLWRLDPYSSLAYDFEKMPSYLALSFAMTQKHLSDIMPRNTVHELERFFQKADTRLQKEESTISPKQYRRLKDSVEFYQRGQRLQAAPIEKNVLDAIYRAILKGKQLRFSYREKTYQVHPFGVVILLPKLYLVAKKEGDSPSSEGFRRFLIHKIEDIELLKNRSCIPEGFSLKDFLSQGNMDVYLSQQDQKRYRLTVELIIRGRSNLVDDLTENPVSSDQQIVAIASDRYRLSASVKRTVQLKNWIIGLGCAATVLEPDIIREDIINELSGLISNYRQ